MLDYKMALSEYSKFGFKALSPFLKIQFNSSKIASTAWSISPESKRSPNRGWVYSLFKRFSNSFLIFLKTGS